MSYFPLDDGPTTWRGRRAQRSWSSDPLVYDARGSRILSLDPHGLHQRTLNELWPTMPVEKKRTLPDSCGRWYERTSGLTDPVELFHTASRRFGEATGGGDNGKRKRTRLPIEARLTTAGLSLISRLCFLISSCLSSSVFLWRLAAKGLRLGATCRYGKSGRTRDGICKGTRGVSNERRSR